MRTINFLLKQLMEAMSGVLRATHIAYDLGMAIKPGKLYPSKWECYEASVARRMRKPLDILRGQRDEEARQEHGEGKSKLHNERRGERELCKSEEARKNKKDKAKVQPGGRRGMVSLQELSVFMSNPRTPRRPFWKPSGNVLTCVVRRHPVKGYK